MFQCKREHHKKKPAQILGQIVAELLGAVAGAADVKQGASPQGFYRVSKASSPLNDGSYDRSGISDIMASRALLHQSP